MSVTRQRTPHTFLHRKLRPARMRDLAAVKHLLATCDLPIGDIKDQFVDHFVVAEKDGKLFGVAGMEVHGAYGLLRSVAVAPGMRGEGLGAELVQDRITWAQAHGLGAVYLLTTTAQDYFAGHGFVREPRADTPAEIKETNVFREFCPESAVVMRFAGEHATESPTGRFETTRDEVRTYYSRAAKNARSGRNACCGGSCGAESAITSDLYETGELAGIPEDAVRASLGCGNPALLAELHAGETVLDLGAGGGIDVLLSARRVGPSGKAYGIDMTDEMLALARDNQKKAGVTNVEFLKGEIEALPLPDSSIDVIISNCVINLSADKPRVLREAFRVLKPGGRFAVSDIVAREAIPAEVRRSAELWAGCVAGALRDTTYRELLRAAGFEDIEVVPTRVYDAEEAGLAGPELDLDESTLRALDGAFMSAFVRAIKPM